MKLLITNDMTRKAIALTNRATRKLNVSLSEKKELFTVFLDRLAERQELKFPE